MCVCVLVRDKPQISGKTEITKEGGKATEVRKKLSASPVMNEPQASGISHHNYHHLMLFVFSLRIFFFTLFSAKLIRLCG